MSNLKSNEAKNKKMAKKEKDGNLDGIKRRNSL